MEGSTTSKNDNKLIEETPSRSKDLSKTLPEEAFNNFLQGKRHMLVQDYTFAVQSLATACEMYTEHFGELAIECGEVFFLYGKALFRLSQQQAGILGGALNEEADEDDQEKSSEEENKENESEKNESDTENGDNDDVEDGEEEKEPSESTDSPQAEAATEDVIKESVAKNEQKTADDGAASNEGNEQEQQEPEEDDLELAWNCLETAKSIFLRQGEDNVEAQLKIADIFQLLAEISMESDNNTAAVNDLNASLSIKKKHLKPDDRILAETYYQMGLAQMLDKIYNDALENFQTTMDILELRKENLKNKPVADTPGSFDRADLEKEIEDLESVVADIKEKVEDTKELIRNAKKDLEEALRKREKESEQVGFSKAEVPENSNKPVSNITHLIKRKKPEQQVEDKESESKRIKLTSSVPNGDTTGDGKL